MKAKIYSHIKLIGTTDLKVGDESMGCVFGEFIPNDTYFKDIQKSVWEFRSTKNPDYKKWYPLRFNVQLGNGYFLYPAGGYTFNDDPELSDDPKTIDIAGLDRHVIEDYFLPETPKIFVEEPWEEITIEQKIGFEDELNKELGLTDKSFLGIFKKGKKHAFSEFEFSALCKYQCNDDVLFVVRNQDFDKQFAIVHLTWKGKKEVEGFPATNFYKDFEEFKYLRMYPDKAEWEY